MNLPKINVALEETGQLLDQLHNQHNNLPNEFTRGKLEGAQEVYKILYNLVTNRYVRTESDADLDDPLFMKGPRVNPQQGNMVKYGGNDAPPPGYPGVQDVAEVQRSLNQQQVGVDNDLLAAAVSELVMIRTTLQENILPLVDVLTNPILRETNDDRPPGLPEDVDWDEVRRATSYAAQNAQEAVNQAFEQDLGSRTNKAWDQSFGAKMRGDDVEGDLTAFSAQPEDYELTEETSQKNHAKQTVEAYEQEAAADRDQPYQPTLPPPGPPVEEEYVDMSTGETTRKRVIGGTLRVDDDDDAEPEPRAPRNWEEYAARENAKSDAIEEPPARVYTPRHPNFNELEDLGPGQV